MKTKEPRQPPPKKELPPSMAGILRKRRRLEEDDTSRDEDLLKMSPVDMVRECAGWELGDRYWADKFARWMVAAGAKPEDF